LKQKVNLGEIVECEIESKIWYNKFLVMDNLKQIEFNPKKNGDDRFKASMNI
jgi:transposase